VAKRGKTVREKEQPDDPQTVTDPNPNADVTIAISGPGLYPEEADLRDIDKNGLVAVDPGIKSIVTAVRLDKPNGKPIQISQAEYREGSMLNYKLKKLGSHSITFKRHMGKVQKILTEAPSKKTIVHFDDYLTALGSVWQESWAYHSRLKLRKINFFAWRRREAWMQKLVNRFKKFAGGAILFGDGANNGFFGKLRYVRSNIDSSIYIYIHIISFFLV
jgi:hypothetical protein